MKERLKEQYVRSVNQRVASLLNQQNRFSSRPTITRQERGQTDGRTNGRKKGKKEEDLEEIERLLVNQNIAKLNHEVNNHINKQPEQKLNQ